MFQVRFVYQGVTTEVAGGLLSEACANAGFPLNLVCGGRGTCGKCNVLVEQSGVKKEVLACREEITGDLAVYLTEEQLSRAASIMTEGRSAHSTVFAPSVSKHCFSRQELIPEHCGAYLDCPNIDVLRKFSLILADQTVRDVTFTYYRDEVIDVEAGDTTAQLYGGAVDIGTTSVVLYAYDLTTGKLLRTESTLNGQIARGADVINRILHTLQNPDGLRELTDRIAATINELLAGVEEHIPGFCSNLYHMVLCGNSTMQHLFLQLSPAGLSADPFVNVTAKMVRLPASQTHLDLPGAATVEFLPLLGGFVGADTSSVLLTLPKSRGCQMMADLGTNGEIAVGNSDGYRVASTACGPALEGGNIACGMRGTNGAIEKISIQGDTVSYRVIGEEAPKGLCGSAIIDAVAELRRTDVIDPSGRLLTAEEYRQLHPGSALADCMGTVGDDSPAFFFVRGENPVYLSQHDVRQIQLAKSSIFSGCMTLLAEAGYTLEQVDAFYLSGAFGNYIDVDKALYIGLLPPVKRDHIISIGNGAGQGVQLCLLNRAQIDRCRELPTHVEHLELATSATFMEEYIMNMNFLN